jgi:hypothetical protein
MFIVIVFIVESSLPPPSDESFSDSPVKPTNSNSFLLPVNPVYKMTKNQDNVAVEENDSVDVKSGVNKLGQLMSGLIIKETPRLLAKPLPPKPTVPILSNENSVNVNEALPLEDDFETSIKGDHDDSERDVFSKDSSFFVLPPVSSDTSEVILPAASLKKRESLISKVCVTFTLKNL